MARRKYTREFKISAVQLVKQKGYGIPEAARSLGVDPNCVRGWMGKYGQEVPVSGDGSVQDELRRLRKENARLTMERDILKKAAAYFAKEQL
jgi:transposase